MTAVSDCAAILLAAGRSQRFGPGDKLMADLGGRPLADHAAEAIAGLEFRAPIAVVRAGAPELSDLLARRGFRIVENDRPEEGVSRSIRLGIEAAQGAQAAVVALADMPWVPAAHLRALCLSLAEDRPIVASQAGDRRTVPAAFLASQFDELARLTGDAGARSLLDAATGIAVDPALLADIDLPDQLAR